MSKIDNDFAPSTDFLKILPDLWYGRKLILLSIALAAVLSAFAAFIMPVTFESEAGLLLMPPPFKESKDEMTSLIPKTLGVPDYEIMLHSDGILSQAVTKVKEEAAGDKKDIWTREELEKLDEVSSLRDRMYVTTDISEKNVTSMKYSPVIRLTARARTPQQAQHLAQAWAEVSQKLAQTLYEKGKSGLTEFMRNSFEDTRKMLNEVNRELRDTEIEWNDELEHARMTKKHERFLTYEEKKTDTDVKIAATRKELEELEKSFAEQPTRLDLWKSPPMESIFVGAELNKKSGAAKSSAAAGTSPDKQYGYEEEVLNQTYYQLEFKLIEKRSELQGLEEFNRQMAEAMDQLDTELQDLRRECAVRDFNRKQLDIQLAPLKSAYDTLSVKVQQAKIAESEQGNLADIKIISEAVTPDKKSWPPRSLLILGAMILATMASSGFVIARGFLVRAGALNFK